MEFSKEQLKAVGSTDDIHLIDSDHIEIHSVPFTYFRWFSQQLGDYSE